MSLEDVRRNWNAFGEIDPHWAILTGPEMAGGKWNEDQFFHTGVLQVDALIERLGELGIEPGGRLLDFGCGLGRTTQAFARHYNECWGVDIAASMIAGAERVNRDRERVHYLCNETDDLAVFDDETFDFVFSYLVLQHMEPAFAERYLREFLRVAKVGAVLVFQVPSHVDIRPLPAGAYRAQISVNAPATMVAGSRVPIRVEVRNVGDSVWRCGSDPCIAVGNHWQRRGRTIQFDDGRTAFPSDIAPGEECAVDLVVTAPERTGKHRLEVDLVQEGVSWFGDQGSARASASVKVRRRGTSLPTTSKSRVLQSQADPPVMEVHGIRYEAVMGIIADHGGSLLVAESHPDALPWKSFTYFVRKTRSVRHEDHAL